MAKQHEIKLEYVFVAADDPTREIPEDEIDPEILDKSFEAFFNVFGRTLYKPPK